ncbi:lasso peptide biosynthesis PqqD family chaperone [Saccharopolyspora sp. K220]|uniref:lasso peptide biosynthesis PqqD family chaperone n=1 Tax=Saccharopolyspora soli TaxID=2926618 RepID=UPI001F57BF15|nr:lasso peptide biosynthesis PqqD family chaperone [Saccharopolyspora soli]MCI2423727.1 lasso peptide biosynthesis PqqD family chaperone [Saccharopolyspora soli]
MENRTKGSEISRVSTEYGEVVLNEATGKYWHLNESATLALNVFEHGGSDEDAVAKFIEVYRIDRETAHEDITALRAQLKGMGLA